MKNQEKIIYFTKTTSYKMTQESGFYLSKLILSESNYLVQKNIILLEGVIGSGKTIFTKGIAQYLDIKENVNSPTFILMKTYQGKIKMHHLDLYRILSFKKENLIQNTIEELLENVKKGEFLIVESNQSCSVIFFPLWHFRILIDFLDEKTRNILMIKNVLS